MATFMSWHYSAWTRKVLWYLLNDHVRTKCSLCKICHRWLKMKLTGVKVLKKMACLLVSSSWGGSQLKEGRERRRVTNVCSAHSWTATLVWERRLVTKTHRMAERAGKRLSEICDSIVRLVLERIYPHLKGTKKMSFRVGQNYNI